MRALSGMALLSAAVLLLQVALTRTFSIAQFYHFAFLVVSLALLGFGASGSLLAIFPKLRNPVLSAWYAGGFAVTAVLAYLFVNHYAFDSYSIAYDRDQVYFLVGNLLALAIPFALAGALIGLLLSQSAERAGIVYGANLAGSAIGAITAPVIISQIGSEETILLSAALGMAAAVVLVDSMRWRVLPAVALVITLIGLVTMPAFFEIEPSEYKTLSHFRLNPDAEIIATRQNAYSRLDIVRSSTIHSAQGLSMTYFGPLPPQHGLLIDGDNLLPVPDTSRFPEGVADNLPAAVAYSIRPEAEVLILGAGGMDIVAAVENEAQNVTVVEPNCLIYEALTEDLQNWFRLPRSVDFQHEEIRTYAQRTTQNYDIVLLSLTDTYRPVTSGAFTLTENYQMTVEAFEAYLELAGDDGLLVLNRWLQTPPTESLRTLAIIIEALGDRDPLPNIVVFRTFQTATFIVKPTPFTEDEVDTLLANIADRNYDLVLALQMPPDMINQYARLERPIYHELFFELATTADRDEFYRDYDFRIIPPTDNQPFFFHFFRWEQTPDIIENLGRRWQPFGGSGYFVLLVLLVFAIAAALVLIMIPVALRRRFRAVLGQSGWAASTCILFYFAALGLGFLLVEVSLIQQYMLTLGQPTLAIAVVIGALLFFSGVGSRYLVQRVPWRVTFIALGGLLMIYSPLTGLLDGPLLSLSLYLRLPLVIVLIVPLGLLMGIPFARGLIALRYAPDLVPWAWAVNGSASVIAAVLAVIVALEVGFTGVLILGGALYLLAGLLAGFTPTAANPA